ncbi:hypothetical protein CGLO_13690 [Colletotrichum gloeosporioides Cg-14]|uniref:Uncharacterized protein n=1 Tax=Colletotrichum gloeosporioides (strain Cg-14) TaxID=1237896 RepID=T0L6K8_COLGC|nr:hypothetical protein CGLO_13690 [Colletotrichum gloeosporioides Cg-14]
MRLKNQSGSCCA